MLLRVTTSSYFSKKKIGCKTYIYKIWEIPLVLIFNAMEIDIYVKC